MSAEDKYAAARAERERYTSAVITSEARRRLVVAGPGTGKTHLFRALLEGKKNTLTLTFVNALVEDLSLGLRGLSKVMTLHAFALDQLLRSGVSDARIFPNLPGVIAADCKILLGKTVQFNTLFHNRCDGDSRLDFYECRRAYYGHYGFADSVLAVAHHLQANPTQIPEYSLVLVDEFQDFNVLEVSLIDLLASRSPVLLAGDDDQALYQRLKNASPDHIRRRYRDTDGYQSFSLPYCSRCTRVIIAAVNDIISAGTRLGCLEERVPKPFVYFEDPKKDEVSLRYRHLVHGAVYPNQVPWVLTTRIAEIASETREKPSVLVMSPTRLQAEAVAEGLRDKGFRHVQGPRSASESISLYDGLRILLEDTGSNLGWRIIAEKLCPAQEFEQALSVTHKDSNMPPMQGLLSRSCRQSVKEYLKVLRAIRDGKDVGEQTTLLGLLSLLGYDQGEVLAGVLRDRLASSSYLDPGLRNIPIRVTTIPGAKGLDADYVFITHCDDRYLIENKDKTKVSDHDICSFIVALTRARKKVFLVSTDVKSIPTFLRWVKPSRIEHARWVRAT